MSHTVRDKKPLLDRVRRIRGQVAAIERALDREEDSAAVLHLIAVCRGAMVSLMSEVVEGHIRLHVLDPQAKANSVRAAAAQQLIGVLRTCLK